MADKIVVNFIQGPDYATSAAQSAQEAKESAANALQSENNAYLYQTMANAAKEYAITCRDEAEASAQAAANSETNASNSATAAHTSETQAAGYASTAFGASAPAWSNTATYNYPDVVAYTDGKTYRCVGTNVTGADVPGVSNQWVAITLDTDDFWDVDIDGGYMPSLSPMYSASWELDGNGDIEPILAN